MVHAARNDQFFFNFKRTFIPKEISDKYYNYVNRLPNAIDDVTDYLNSTIQGITMPTREHEPQIQNQKGIETGFLGSRPWQALNSKEFEITFQLVDGYVNYLILYEVFDYYYKFKDNKNLHIDPFDFFIMDYDGLILSSFKAKQVIFKRLSQLELSYADNIQQFKTFTATFMFNELIIELPAQ